MDRPPSCCDFCGQGQVSQEYPADHGIINWYACADCASLIDAEKWNWLIDRSLAAYARIRAVPDTEESMLREQVARLVYAFRAFRLVPV